MKKLVLILTIAVNSIVIAQCVEETKSIDNIIKTFKSIHEVNLTDSALHQFYLDVSKLNFNQQVLIIKSVYNDTVRLTSYEDNNIFKTTKFLNNQLNNLIRVYIDTSNINNPSRTSNLTDFDIKIFYRDTSGNFKFIWLTIHITSGVINYIHEVDDYTDDVHESYEFFGEN